MKESTNIRIKELRKNVLNLTQDEFGSRLGLTKTAISYVESGKNNATNRLILSICREFNVREDWLRNGTGDMFESMSKEEQVGSILGKVFTDTESDLYDFKMSVFSELGKLSDSDWEVIQRLVDGIKKK